MVGLGLASQPRKALKCSLWQFPWYEYMHHGCFYFQYLNSKEERHALGFQEPMSVCACLFKEQGKKLRLTVPKELA